MTIQPAETAPDLEQVRILIREYVAGLGLDLSFQGFHAEMAHLPGRYAPPGGTLLLARDPSGHPVGCAGVRPLNPPATCEMKRLYVRPGARATGLGRTLVHHALAFAAQAGYARILLDTMPGMTAAQTLYRAMGFTETTPYQPATVPGMLFFSKALP